MPVKQVPADSLLAWPPSRTATRDLNEDFSPTVLEISDLVAGVGLNVSKLIVSALTPKILSAFNWEAAERRAVWEESHSRFVEFGNVKDLLSDLHS